MTVTRRRRSRARPGEDDHRQLLPLLGVLDVARAGLQRARGSCRAPKAWRSSGRPLPRRRFPGGAGRASACCSTTGRTRSSACCRRASSSFSRRTSTCRSVPWAATLPEDRGWHPGIFPIARLKDGVTLEQARVEMDAIARQLEAEFPESNRNVRVLVTRAQDQLVQNVRPALLLLLGRGRARAADRLRERRQPAARARRRSAEGDRRPHRARRQPRRASSASSSSRASCWRASAAPRACCVASWGVSLLTSASVGGPAARAEHRASSGRSCLRAGAVGAHRDRVRPRARAAGHAASDLANRSTKKAAAAPAACGIGRCASTLVVARDRARARAARRRRPAAAQLLER